MIFLNKKPLPRDFYLQNTTSVARKLIGKRLFRKLADGRIISGVIAETEAYLGESDTACHSRVGKTQRNKIMFGNGGFLYIYLIYGMYYMLNIVTEGEGRACAVLIRAVVDVKGFSSKETIDGPGKLCREFEITKEQYGVDVCKGNSIWIERDKSFSKPTICSLSRVGIAYASKADRQALLRFRMQSLKNS